MPYASVEPTLMGWSSSSDKNAKHLTRRVAIVLFDGFSLLGAGLIAEVFHLANELADTDTHEVYEVCFLSAVGGNVACSSSVKVWTDSLQSHADFDALFVAGGKGVHAAANDERLTSWLRRVRTKTTGAIAEGRVLLRAAGIIQHPFHNEHRDEDEASERIESIKKALMLIKRDLGLEAARQVAQKLTPSTSMHLVTALGEAGSMSAGDKIRAAARWLRENCERPISIANAAQIASMSERNFLRRFKLEMGVTPSDYLLQIRLTITCNLLTDSELPIDKIARRSGMGNGDRLAKIFRKRMMISPTEFRIQSRRSLGN